MTNPTPATDPAKQPGVADVIDAMRSIQTESDRWALAEALCKQIPEGAAGFDEIIDAATSAGVAGSLSVTTLRLYRDAAKRWPSDQRVPDVSFSAHREAMVLIPESGSTAVAAKMLGDLAKTQGAAKVTVASVRKAVAVKQGKAIPSSGSSTASSTSTRALDVLDDVKKGAPQLIAAISPATESDDLDKLHAGLTKAIAHVERLRSKAAAKAKAASKKASAPTTTAPATAKAKGARKAQGDLRGL